MKCQLCGSELKFYVITYHDVVDSETLENCIKNDNFSDLYTPTGYDTLKVICDNNDCCGKLSDKDTEKLQYYFELEFD